MHLEATPPELARLTPDPPRVYGQDLVGCLQMADVLTDRPWDGAAAATAAACCGRSCPGLADEIVAAISARRARLRAAARGPVRRGAAHRGRGGAAAVRRHGRAPGRRARRRPRGVRGPRPRRDARRAAASTPCWPPTASARGWPGGAWRRPARRAGLEPRTLYLLAESIFAYIDELSGESIEGYARSRRPPRASSSGGAGASPRLLVQDPPADAGGGRGGGRRGGWALPRGAGGGGRARATSADRLALRLGADAIAAHAAAAASCALVPDPDAPGRRAQLEAAFDGRRGALGPTVPWRGAAVSAARAHGRCSASPRTAAIDGASGLLRRRRPLASRCCSSADRRLARDLADARARAARRARRRASRERLGPDAARLAAPPRPDRGGGRGAARASADRALPPGPPARAVRRRARGSGRRFELELALRARRRAPG